MAAEEVKEGMEVNLAEVEGLRGSERQEAAAPETAAVAQVRAAEAEFVALQQAQMVA